ncbi:MAG: metal-sensing transcriptional repressor [Patescibacteria group bacterium]|nr:metal-sensing transcriptional repressor [Patescibacteria group bacterium]
MPKGIPRDKSVKHIILHRLKIAGGHLDKVVEMVEKGEYCIDVIHQSLAVQAALREADKVILKNHLKTCVVSAIKRGKEREVIAEVMKVMDKNGH